MLECVQAILIHCVNQLRRSISKTGFKHWNNIYFMFTWVTDIQMQDMEIQEKHLILRQPTNLELINLNPHQSQHVAEVKGF